MSKRAHLSFRPVVPVIALSLIAFSGCGDDEGSKDAGMAGKGDEAGKAGSAAGRGGSSGAAGASGSSGRGGAGGATGSGEKMEGEQCTTTAQCMMGLSCVNGLVDDTQVRFCARSCTPATEAAVCGTEACATFSDSALDSVCVNFEPAPFAVCGIGETAACGGQRTCLYLPEYTIGFCVDYCATDPTVDAGFADVLAKCPGSMSCITDILTDPAVGLCGTYVKRGEACGLDVMGTFCEDGDVCAPDDQTNDESAQHCREDCTKTGACTMGGTCTAYRNFYSYCKK